MAAAIFDNPTPVMERVCARCAASALDEASGGLNCNHPSVVTDDGRPVSCHKQRNAFSSALMHICGAEGIFFEPKA